MATIEEQLQGIAAGGWDSMDQSEAVLREAAKQRRIAERQKDDKDRALVRAALANPAGAALLAWLEANTIKLPPQAAEQNAVSAEAYALAMKRREGMNAVVFKLLELLAERDENEETQA